MFAAARPERAAATPSSAGAEPSEPGDHGAEAIEQDNDGPDPRLGGEAENDGGLEGGCRFPRLGAGTTEPTVSVGPIACRPFGELKVGSEQRPTELFGELAVTSGQLACDGVPEAEGLENDSEGIEIRGAQSVWDT